MNRMRRVGSQLSKEWACLPIASGPLPGSTGIPICIAAARGILTALLMTSVSVLRVNPT